MVLLDFFLVLSLTCVCCAAAPGKRKNEFHIRTVLNLAFSLVKSSCLNEYSVSALSNFYFASHFNFLNHIQYDGYVNLICIS